MLSQSLPALTLSLCFLIARCKLAVEAATAWKLEHVYRCCVGAVQTTSHLIFSSYFGNEFQCEIYVTYHDNGQLFHCCFAAFDLRVRDELFAAAVAFMNMVPEITNECNSLIAAIAPIANSPVLNYLSKHCCCWCCCHTYNKSWI